MKNTAGSLWPMTQSKRHVPSHLDRRCGALQRPIGYCGRERKDRTWPVAAGAIQQRGLRGDAVIAALHVGVQTRRRPIVRRLAD